MILSEEKNPIWQKNDFVMKSPMVDNGDNRVTIGWAIQEKDTDVTETFQLTLSIEDLSMFECPVHILMSKIVEQSVNYITNYVDKNDFYDMEYEHLIDHVGFISRLRNEVHTFFVKDNIDVLRTFEKILEEKWESFMKV